MAGGPPFDYPGALQYITSTGRFGIKMGLERTRALLEAAGSPDRGMIGALVAGTNGKGSTCAVLGAILGAAGYRVAAMPKPHLLSYTERVVIDGVPISETDFAAAVGAIVPAVDAVARDHGPATEFEILTAVALAHARRSGADLLVCEVGMGGRLDATNTTDLGVKVITSIALDHQRYLGETIPEIAAEKAGIVRPGDIVVAGPLPEAALDVVRARCAEVGAELLSAKTAFQVTGRRSGWDGTELDLVGASVGWVSSLAGLHSSLLGGHQADNVAVAVVGAQAVARRHGLSVPADAIRAGVEAARWPGRLERFPGSPGLLLDGGHNPDAVAAVVDAVSRLSGPAAPVMVFGAMADKDIDGMLGLLPSQWPAVYTQVPEDRAVPAADLLARAGALGRREDIAHEDPAAALAAARRLAGPDGLVLVLGSLYLAGAVRGLLTAAG